MLLKAEILESKLLATNKAIAQLQNSATFKEYEQLITQLHTLGYKQMPDAMRKYITATIQGDSTVLPPTVNPQTNGYASLSKGILVEDIKETKIEQYNHTLYNTKTNKITGFTPTIQEDVDVVFALSVDPLAHMAPGWSPYRSFFDNPIKYSDYDGRFEVDPDFAKAYPKVTLILMNADKLYNNQPLPPDVQKALEGIDVQAVFNEKFRPALEKYSTLNNEQLQEVVTPGKGPIIASYDLDFDHLVNGKTLQNYDQNGNPLPQNLDDIKGDRKGKLIIDDDVVQVLEFELKGGNGETPGLTGFGGKSPSDKGLAKAFKSFVSTLFHEVVHYGKFKSGAGNSGADDGKNFEIETFGEDVKRTPKNNTKNSTGTEEEE